MDLSLCLIGSRACVPWSTLVRRHRNHSACYHQLDGLLPGQLHNLQFLTLKSLLMSKGAKGDIPPNFRGVCRDDQFSLSIFVLFTLTPNLHAVSVPNLFLIPNKRQDDFKCVFPIRSFNNSHFLNVLLSPNSPWVVAQHRTSASPHAV